MTWVASSSQPNILQHCTIAKSCQRTILMRIYNSQSHYINRKSSSHSSMSARKPSRQLIAYAQHVHELVSDVKSFLPPLRRDPHATVRNRWGKLWRCEKLLAKVYVYDGTNSVKPWRGWDILCVCAYMLIRMPAIRFDGPLISYSASACRMATCVCVSRNLSVSLIINWLMAQFAFIYTLHKNTHTLSVSQIYLSTNIYLKKKYTRKFCLPNDTTQTQSSPGQCDSPVLIICILKQRRHVCAEYVHQFWHVCLVYPWQKKWCHTLCCWFIHAHVQTRVVRTKTTWADNPTRSPTYYVDFIRKTAMTYAVCCATYCA